MMAFAGLWSLFNLVVLVLLVVLAIFGIQALRKYLKTPAALPAAGGLSLGARLCRQRQAQGMTVESVAQTLGVTPQEVEAWEKDAADPTDQQLMDLAALYGGTLAALFRSCARFPTKMPPLGDPWGLPGAASFVSFGR